MKFHVIPTFLSTSYFQTVSNPLGTWAGTGTRLPLNVTLYPNSVNTTTGLTNTSTEGTVYTDNQLAIYCIEKVLLLMDIFTSKAPAPAPAAHAPEKHKKASPAVKSCCSCGYIWCSKFYEQSCVCVCVCQLRVLTKKKE